MTFWRPKAKRYPPLGKIDIGIDQSFTVQEKRNVIEGLIRWQDGTDGLVLFHIGNMSMNKLIMNDDDGYTWYAMNIIKAYHTDPSIQEYEKQFKHKINGLAVWHDNTHLAFVVVDKIKTKEEFIGLVMHEVGHLLGLSHWIKDAVMYKYSGRPTRVAAADRYQLVNAWRKWFRLD